MPSSYRALAVLWWGCLEPRAALSKWEGRSQGCPWKSLHLRMGLSCIAIQTFRSQAQGERRKNFLLSKERTSVWCLPLPCFHCIAPPPTQIPRHVFPTILSTCLHSPSVKMLFHQKNKSQLGFRRRVGIIHTNVWMADEYHRGLATRYLEELSKTLKESTIGRIPTGERTSYGNIGQSDSHAWKSSVSSP